MFVWLIVALIALFLTFRYRQLIENIFTFLGETATELSNEYNKVYLEENEKDE
jgi:hypothetical protein